MTVELNGAVIPHDLNEDTGELRVETDALEAGKNRIRLKSST